MDREMISGYQEFEGARDEKEEPQRIFSAMKLFYDTMIVNAVFVRSSKPVACTAPGTKPYWKLWTLGDYEVSLKSSRGTNIPAAVRDVDVGGGGTREGGVGGDRGYVRNPCATSSVLL